MDNYCDQNPGKMLINVSTGEVHSGGGMVVFRSSALGSCIAVAAIDPVSQVGGMIHFMLPGRCPIPREGRLRYAWDGVQELLRQLDLLAVDRVNLAVVVAGGGNVLRRPDDQICAENINSIRELLAAESLAIRGESLGGVDRRCLILDLAAATAFCSVGEGPGMPLWKKD